MDPASVIGVIGVIAQITQAIYVYGDAVKGCKLEVAQLRSELFGMRAALTQVEQDLTYAQGDGGQLAASTNLGSPQCQEMLTEAQLVLEKLADTLKDGSSRAGHLRKKLIWPLKRPQVQTMATHLERIKTFFILAATRDNLHATENIWQSFHTLQYSVKEIEKTQQEESIYLEAMDWLTPCDPNGAHATAASSRLTGTNSWFLDEALQDWVSGTAPFCWLKGKPGSGKTCLMSACADRLLQAGCTVSYFYCSYNDSSSQEPRNILGSLVVQLCRQHAAVREAIVAVYQESRARNSLHELVQVPMLLSLIRQAVATISTELFIFVDAADECGDHLVSALGAIFEVVTGCSRVKLMLSSTENVAQTIRDSTSLYTEEVNLDISMVSQDINAYIDARFAQEPRLKRLRYDLQASVIKTIQSQHEGSFRWASCTIDELIRRNTPKAIKSALDGVASTLGDIYMAVLGNIPGDVIETATSMLQYLVSAMRPLTLEELGEVASLVLTDEFGEDDRLIEPEAIVNALRSLVHRDLSSQRIELAHSSVRAFLTDPTLSGPFYVDPVAANNAMARACIYYLALPPFEQLCADGDALAARKRDWPFLEYASCFWTRHTRRMAYRCDEYQALFARFAPAGGGGGGGCFASWYQCVCPWGNAALWAMTSPLYMCAREGLVEPLKAILANCTADELERRGGVRGSTALHVAATYGEVEAVKLLLAAGANPNERNAFGVNGIQWAAYWNHRETVQVLLEAGADPDLLAYTSNLEPCRRMVMHSQASVRHNGTEYLNTSDPAETASLETSL